jgi:hypothetical protein
MKTLEDPRLLLGLMHEHEKLISELYSVFAKRFPQYEEFWNNLSNDEIKHAEWIEKLQTDVNNSKGVVVERFPAAAIERSSNFVRALIQQTSELEFTLINAISHALNLEEALIENRYFEIFQSQSSEVQMTLNSLKNETQKHFKLIRSLRQEINNLSKFST